MRLFDYDAAMRIMMDIHDFDMTAEEAIISELILELRIPWNSDISVLDVHDGMVNYCKKNGKHATDFEWAINGEFLWAKEEGAEEWKKAKRVLPMFYYYDFDPRIDYLESKIMSRAEPVT